MKLCIWFTHVESWHAWKAVLHAKTEVHLFIIECLEKMLVTYKLPEMPISEVPASKHMQRIMEPSQSQ